MMIRTTTTLLVLALAATCVLAKSDPSAKLTGVHDLSVATFDSVVNGQKSALVEFYAPWCGHCVGLVPEMKKLGEMVANNPKLNSRVTIAKVNADDHRPLGERFAVRGFPTIKWFPRGSAQPIDYSGARTAVAIIAWIQEQLDADAGFARVSELAEIAVKYKDGEITAEKAVAAAKIAAASVADDVKENAALYVKFLEKAAEKGKAYIDTELARLKKMIEGGAKMSAAKMMDFSRKVSVLESFEKQEEVPQSSGMMNMGGEDYDGFE